MNIAIDGNEANVGQKVGVSVYTYELLNYFQKKATKDLRFTVFLRTKPGKHMPSQTNYFSYRVVYGPFAWSQFFLPLRLICEYLFGTRYGVFFSPAHYAPRLLPCNSVVTIHDLSYIHYPSEFLKKDLYQLTHWTRYSIQNAKSVIAVSQATKKDVIQEYALDGSMVHVIYNGYSHDKGTQSSEAQWKPYILYVGTIQPRKNIKTLVDAFSTFNKMHPEFRLMIAGKKGWMYEDTLSYIKTSSAAQSIQLLGFIDDIKKNELYKNAFCTVLPSFYEGFGLPMLEAMSNGCPVLASQSSSLPEVGGDAAIYFDPNSSQVLLTKLEQLYTNHQLRSSKVKQGFMQVNHFSWELCGKQTLDVLLQNAS